MRHVFVSGCYDPLHAGHLQFFRDARALGDYLTVCFASADVLWAHKQRRPSLPDTHRGAILQSLKWVDQVVRGEGRTLGLDFEDVFIRLRPNLLAVTEDDRYADLKRELCARVGAEYRVVPKTPPLAEPLSSTEITRRARRPHEIPLRVDFGGGWLDCGKFAREGAFVVNLAIQPLIRLDDSPYQRGAGLGGSAAHAILQGRDPFASEDALGVGWQDPAVILETGLCCWRSGPSPVLELKRNPEFLDGLLALHWTGQPHDTPSNADRPRRYPWIEHAGHEATAGVAQRWYPGILKAVRWSYEAQVDEGMGPLPEVPQSLAWKYLGGGWGGYALYLFATREHRDASGLIRIEPYLRAPGG